MRQFRDTDYWVTEDGRIWSKKQSGKFLSPSKNRCGYLQVVLKIGGQRHTFTIHRLVAECYLEDFWSYPEVNHIDGNKLNNHVSNLECCDSSHNKKHAFKLGLRDSKGISNSQSKLTEQQVLDIRQIYSEGHYTQYQLADMYKVKVMTINNIVNRKRWTHI